MILGVGSDLVRVERIARSLEQFGERFTRRIFTPGEVERCERRADRAACYAKRFAAKEALVKALGTGIASGVGWRDIEVMNDPGGRPRLQLSGAALARLQQWQGVKLHLSLSDEGGFALAFVVVEGEPAVGE